jgi:hypothetical protein
VLTGTARLAAWAVLGSVAFIVGMVAMASRSTHPMAGMASGEATSIPVASPAAPPPAKDEVTKAKAGDGDRPNEGWRNGYVTDTTVAQGQVNERQALGGVVQGVAPVALTLPQYERSVYASRELVTRDRPFSPVVVYVTTLGLAPFALAWLVCVALLARLCRGDIARFVRGVRARVTRKPEADAPPEAPTPAAPPPIVA